MSSVYVHMRFPLFPFNFRMRVCVSLCTCTYIAFEFRKIKLWPLRFLLLYFSTCVLVSVIAKSLLYVYESAHSRRKQEGQRTLASQNAIV